MILNIVDVRFGFEGSQWDKAFVHYVRNLCRPRIQKQEMTLRKAKAFSLSISTNLVELFSKTILLRETSMIAKTSSFI
jgi:hypothetical protein